jgi:hypothetical protein
MNELTLDGKVYISSKRAAEVTGYAKDYVGQLCREGHVEARLVGRNWYVLESSIRDHRFGKEKADAKETAPKTSAESSDSWGKPRYESEVSSYLPSFSDRKPQQAPQKEVVIGDTESAWKEWFALRKAQEDSEAEPIPESAVQNTEETSSQVEEDNEEQEEQGMPVPIRSLEQEPIEEGEEEVVILHKSTAGPSRDDAAPEEPLPRVRRLPRRSGIRSNLVLQSTMIAISLLAVAIAAIGTGYAEKFASLGVYRLPEINFIAGVSTYNRP